MATQEERLRKIEERQQELERQKQRLLHGSTLGENQKAFIKAMEANDGFGFSWDSLLSLALICNGQVPPEAQSNLAYAQQVIARYQSKPRKKREPQE